MIKQVPPPRKHQVEALDFVADLPFYAVFAEQGTGKTKISIMKVDFQFHKKEIDSIIVIAPNSVVPQWPKEEFEKHYPYDYNYFIWDGCKTKKSLKAYNDFLESDKDKLKIFAINVEAFQFKSVGLYVKQFLTNHNPHVIIDESTRIKNPQALRTKTICDLSLAVKYKSILTGTPTPNSPFDIYSQFNFLKRGFWGMSFHQFKHRYGILLRDTNRQTGKTFYRTMDEGTFKFVKDLLKNAGEPLNEYKVAKVSAISGVSEYNILLINKMQVFSPYKNLEELHEKIKPYTFKALKKDCLDLPPKTFEKLEVEMSPEQKRIYKELKKNYMTIYDGLELSFTNKIVLTLRLQMITSGLFPYPVETLKKNSEGDIDKIISYETKAMEKNPKLKALLEDLDEVPKDDSIIIWATFNHEIRLIGQALLDKGYTVGLHYGKIDETERRSIIDKFKAGEIKFLVANKTAAEGLNLQICSLQYFFSNWWQYDKREQMEDRSHRDGQESNKVVYKDIICKDSIDQRIMQAFKSKKSVIDFFRSNEISELIT
jgi:SNF2 family DNA or RNA helicase